MQEFYRMIPKVDFFMQKREMTDLTEQYGREAVLEVLREELEKLREMAGTLYRQEAQSRKEAEGEANGESAGADWEGYTGRLERLPELVERGLRQRQLGRFQRVINATGTVLHTNLGRAPLSPQLVQRAEERLTGYSNLEYDLAEGCRGERCASLEALLRRLTGAEAALVVNNNAAAVLLTVSALAAGREVMVSRGELVEIGGKFRIPDVIVQGGALLREVGTTNKTRLEDYRQALGAQTGAILKVHTSNFRIQGFAESVPAGDLAGLGVPLIWDLGSGVLLRPEQGAERETTVRQAVSQGADVVCFSADKLLGGPQAGILAGKKELIDRIRRHPLMRAVRIGKLTAAVLETVLEEYEKGENNARERIPVLRLLGESPEALERRAIRLGELAARAAQGPDFEPEGTRLGQWLLRVEACQSLAGGGALPGETFSGAALTVTWLGEHPGGAAESLRRRLRWNETTPVIACVEKGRLRLDVRTVLEGELTALAGILARALTTWTKEEESEADYHRDGGTY